MPLITIDGRPIDAAPRQSILEAARSHGITIPTLCYHPDLSVVGSCRLCLVEIGGFDRLMPSCHQPVIEGMVIQTETPRIVNERRLVLEMLLRNYVDGARVGHDTEFLKWVRHYDVERPEDFRPAARFAVDADPHPMIRVDLNKCILCTRCIRACNEVQGRFVWNLADRGHDAQIVAGVGTTMLDARCESCGACAAYCPTGALVDRAAITEAPVDRVVTTTCGYCGVGCQFDIQVSSERIARIASHPEAPVNGMALCVKGRYGAGFVHHRDRLTMPRVRAYLLRGVAAKDRPAGRGAWVEVEWETALKLVAQQLCAIKQQSGGDEIGFLSSAKCTNEENYLLQKLARQIFGTNNVDHCARLCHASTVAGLTMALGTGAMSNSMKDISEQAAAMFLIGSNVTEQHPVFGSMIRQAVVQRGMPLIVADPRKIDITEFAVLHLRQRPGTDVALLNGIMHEILRNGWHDAAFIERQCEGSEAFRESLASYPAEEAARISGVPAKQICDAAAILGRHRPAAAIWAMGITQHTTGVLNVLALANLQMLLGNLGVPGGGVNPLRGQNNVQGACDMGALPNVLPGYQLVSDRQVVDRFQRAWALQSSDEAESPKLASAPGLTVTEMIAAAGSGQLRGLVIVGENPVATDPDSNKVRRLLESAEFVVLQEIFASETADYADVLLPGASFAEKDGTFTNTERRVQRVRRAVPSPGQARADWSIFAELANCCLQNLSLQPIGPWANWSYQHPAEIQLEIAALTPVYAGVTHARLDARESLQWPVWDLEHPGTPILHVGQISRGKGKLHAVDHLPAAELPDAEYPWLLTTGRVLYHWHAGEMTRRVAGLLAICPEAAVEIHPDDAVRLQIEQGQMVSVVSRRGRMLASALVTDRVAPGVLFGNFHFPGEHNVNNLTNCALDPTAKIPEYKVCAVRIESATSAATDRVERDR